MENQMKVLFLDIDGCLNLYPNPSRSGRFDKEACFNLEMLLNKVPDLKIVISSSWRTYGLEAVRDILASNGIDPRRVIDTTGHEESEDHRDHRGFQVEKWLGRHPSVKQFVILDDNDDFVPLLDKLVRTNKTVGLTQSNVEKILTVLREN
jgi:HAD domain in Swiss Army Knife RNA repair proteins